MSKEQGEKIGAMASLDLNQRPSTFKSCSLTAAPRWLLHVLFSCALSTDILGMSKETGTI